MSSGLAKRKIDDPSAGLKKQRVEGKDEKKTEKILIGRVYYDSMDDYIKESMAMFGTLHKELKQKMEKFDRCEKSWDDYFAGKITIDKIERDDEPSEFSFMKSEDYEIWKAQEDQAMSVEGAGST